MSRHLRQLAGEAYSRELNKALRALDVRFSDWHEGRIDAFQLADHIEKFHEAEARDMHVLYTRLKPVQAVGRALVLGLVERDEIDERALEEVEGAAELFQTLHKRHEDEDTDRLVWKPN